MAETSLPSIYLKRRVTLRTCRGYGEGRSRLNRVVRDRPNSRQLSPLLCQKLPTVALSRAFRGASTPSRM